MNDVLEHEVLTEQQQLALNIITTKEALLQQTQKEIDDLLKEHDLTIAHLEKYRGKKPSSRFDGKINDL